MVTVHGCGLAFFIMLGVMAGALFPYGLIWFRNNGLSQRAVGDTTVVYWIVLGGATIAVGLAWMLSVKSLA